MPALTTSKLCRLLFMLCNLFSSRRGHVCSFATPTPNVCESPRAITLKWFDGFSGATSGLRMPMEFVMTRASRHRHLDLAPGRCNPMFQYYLNQGEHIRISPGVRFSMAWKVGLFETPLPSCQERISLNPETRENSFWLVSSLVS